MRWAFLKLAFPAAVAWSGAGCYFFSSFDDLQGGTGSGTATSTTGGAGGSTNTTTTSTTTSQTAGTQSASSSSTGGVTGSTTGSGGSGGGESCPPPGTQYTGLVLNELAPKGLPDDWIELRNTGPLAIPLCGVRVTQDYDDITIPSGPDAFIFGDIVLAPGKYVVILAGPELPFGLAKDAPERISLFAPDGKLLDDTSWVATTATEFTPFESWARIPDGVGAFKRVNNPTKGTSNFELGGADAGTGDAGGGV